MFHSLPSTLPPSPCACFAAAHARSVPCVVCVDVPDNGRQADHPFARPAAAVLGLHGAGRPRRVSVQTPLWLPLCHHTYETSSAVFTQSGTIPIHVRFVTATRKFKQSVGFGERNRSCSGHISRVHVFGTIRDKRSRHSRGGGCYDRIWTQNTIFRL